MVIENFSSLKEQFKTHLYSTGNVIFYQLIEVIETNLPVRIYQENNTKLFGRSCLGNIDTTQLTRTIIL